MTLARFVLLFYGITRHIIDTDTVRRNQKVNELAVFPAVGELTEQVCDDWRSGADQQTINDSCDQVSHGAVYIDRRFGVTFPGATLADKSGPSFGFLAASSRASGELHEHIDRGGDLARVESIAIGWQGEVG